MLFDNKAALAEAGTLYPGRRRNDHFLASLDLREAAFLGHTYERAEGAWDRLVREVDGHDGASLISHETFARTPADLVERAVKSFGTDDVRVVITARDLGRQIPAMWQERIKNRGERAYGAYLDRILRAPRGSDREAEFWIPMDYAALTARWAAVVGAARVTVVTVPRPGADPGELWRRFAQATELPDVEITWPDRGANPSLGVVESELLRRLNPRLKDVAWPEYEARVKRRFAEQTLVGRAGNARLSVPTDYHEAVRSISEEIIADLGSSGVTVVGDLDELRPEFGADAGMPEQVDRDVLLDLALDLVATYASRPVPRPGPPTKRGKARRLAGRIRNRLRRWRARG